MNIEKAFLKAIRDYGMLSEGDRVLIGASGGKDSLVLSWLMGRLVRRRGSAIEVTALRVIGGGAPEPDADDRKAFEALYAQWSVPLRFVRKEPIEGDRDCYRCATLRREALMAFALENGFNKIALGHHLDDILTTALMNMVNRGDVEGMEASRSYEKFGVVLIRPLAYVPEESIRRLRDRMNWTAHTCACPQGTFSRRTEFRRRLDILTDGDLQAKLRLYGAVSSLRREVPGE